MKWIDSRILDIIKGLLIVATTLTIILLVVQFWPMATLDVVEPIPVDKNVVCPGDKISVHVKGYKHTSESGWVSWLLVGKDTAGATQRYVLLSTPTTNPKGPMDLWVNLIVWSETKPGLYHVEQGVYYKLFGGLRTEPHYHIGQNVQVKDCSGK